MHWAAVTEGKRGHNLAEHLADLANLAPGIMVRLHQAGDFESAEHAPQFARVLGGRQAWTYSHHRAAGFLESFRAINTLAAHNGAGLTVNLSADNLPQADTLLQTGAGPVCAVVPSTYAETVKPADRKTPAGARVVVCPQQTGQVPNCKACGNGRPLCARPSRDYVIGFLAHGSSVTRADRLAGGG